ncbi:phosphohistidine phosphatase SixA [Alteromonas sp. 5E99-2]|uniref:phosphohistidine phosphatase SixA n=1 Tax=Alteromonas sp. 5E99-2 TaxID=2817683 RepID=UPI001A98A77A|nr:phosphohistidine phosphatase SixA [Alteromonas sp. 5E99-2]MBO1256090.1 phosphohistidine phosphatase SixA [Alteromonas sp. 5E99-2]
MRHGMAENMVKNDASRQLVSVGEEQARDTSYWFSQHYPHIKIDLALVSPYVRAEQTFNIVKGHIPIRHKLISRDVTPDASAAHFCDYLSALLESKSDFNEINAILIVSHMPFVSFLMSEVLYSKEGVLFNTGSMAVVECDRATLKGILAKHYQGVL